MKNKVKLLILWSGTSVVTIVRNPKPEEIRHITYIAMSNGVMDNGARLRVSRLCDGSVLCLKSHARGYSDKLLKPLGYNVYHVPNLISVFDDDGDEVIDIIENHVNAQKFTVTRMINDGLDYDALTHDLLSMQYEGELETDTPVKEGALLN